MSVIEGSLPAPAEHADFAGLDIEWDRRVLRPRRWTAEQSLWAADLAQHAPEGPILELCCGAGQIGLLAARTSGRPLVQVDRDPVAAAYARRNAAAAGVEADVRCGAIGDVLAPDESFGLVVADPPWLPSGWVDDYPDDPVGAVDGGVDGLDSIRECLVEGVQHLEPTGHLVLQIGASEQLTQVVDYVARRAQHHTVSGVRDCRPGGILVHVGPNASVTQDSQEAA